MKTVTVSFFQGPLDGLTLDYDVSELRVNHVLVRLVSPERGTFYLSDRPFDGEDSAMHFHRYVANTPHIPEDFQEI